MTRAGQFIASERQEPYTATEHARETGRQAEYARDVPRSCSCSYMWNPVTTSYQVIGPDSECPWHVRRTSR